MLQRKLPTIENIYKAEHSIGTGDSKRLSDGEWNEMVARQMKLLMLLGSWDRHS